MKEFISRSEEETEKIGAFVASCCARNDFVALYGDMGSGKTVFMRGFTSSLIPNCRVSSPTYTILNVYEGEDVSVNHFDMYRISSEDDLISTGYEDVLDHGITVTEWSENITEYLPSQYWKVEFHKIEPSTRRITMERIGK